MPEQPQRGSTQHTGALIWGMMLGACMGALAMLLNLPEKVVQARQKMLEAPRDLITGEKVSESIEQGKQTARRHREALRSQE